MASRNTSVARCASFETSIYAYVSVALNRSFTFSGAVSTVRQAGFLKNLLSFIRMRQFHEHRITRPWLGDVHATFMAESKWACFKNNVLPLHNRENRHFWMEPAVHNVSLFVKVYNSSSCTFLLYNSSGAATKSGRDSNALSSIAP